MNSRVLKVCALAAVGAMFFGMDNANWSGTSNKPDFLEIFCWQGGFDKRLDGLQNCLSGEGDVQSAQWATALGLMAGMLQVGAGFSCMAIAPHLTDRIGRKPCMLTGCVVVIVGLILMSVSRTVYSLGAGRFVLGLGVGLVPYTLTMYMSEVAPKESRGAMTSLFQLMVMVGVVLASVISVPQQWPFYAGFLAPIVPAVVLIVGLLFLPESPRWLLQKRRAPEALAVLSWLRKGRTEVAVQHELQEMETATAAEAEAAAGGSWCDLLNHGVWQRVAAVVGLQVFQQMTGINAVVMFGSLFSKSAGLTGSKEIVGTLLFNGANLAGTVVMILFIDRAGRRRLLLGSSLAQAAAFITLGSLLRTIPMPYTEAQGWGVVGLVMAYNFAFGCAWGGIPWVYPSEVFAPGVKSRGMALSSFAQYFSTWFISFGFPVVNHAIGMSNCVFLFAAFLLGSMAFVAAFVPETKGRSLEDMDALFENRQICALYCCHSKKSASSGGAAGRRGNIKSTMELKLQHADVEKAEGELKTRAEQERRRGIRG